MLFDAFLLRQTVDLVADDEILHSARQRIVSYKIVGGNKLPDSLGVFSLNNLCYVDVAVSSVSKNDSRRSRNWWSWHRESDRAFIFLRNCSDEMSSVQVSDRQKLDSSMVRIKANKGVICVEFSDSLGMPGLELASDDG